MTQYRKTYLKGFTLIEALVATVVLAGGMIALHSLTTRSLAQTKSNRLYERACQLLDRQLIAVETMGIDAFIDLPTRSGQINDGDTNYNWDVHLVSEAIDYLYEITVAISWQEHQKWRSVSASTRFNGLAVDITGTSTESTSTGQTNRGR